MSVNHRLRMNNRILLIETERVNGISKKLDVSLRGMRRLFVFRNGHVTLNFFKSISLKYFYFHCWNNFSVYSIRLYYRSHLNRRFGYNER